MKTHIVNIVIERLKQLENEYLTNAMLLATFAPDYPIPVYKPDMIKEKVMLNNLCGFCSCTKKEKWKKYMTVKEAMAVLNVSRNTIHRMRKEGILTSFYKNRAVAILTSEVEQVLETYSKMKGKI